MQDDLWAGVELALDSAQFHFLEGHGHCNGQSEPR